MCGSGVALLLFAGFLLSSGEGHTAHSEGKILYVKSPHTRYCQITNEVPCLLFSECIQNVSLCFTSNTTIHFLPGNYTISGNTPVIVQDVANLTLVGPSSQHPSATLHCHGNTSFVFADVANLSISGLRITNCGSEVPNSPRHTRELLSGTRSRAALYKIFLGNLLHHYFPGQLSQNDFYNHMYKAGNDRYLYVQPNRKFSECIQNVSLCFTSNTIIHFLPGNYTISGNTPVIVQDVANLTLVGPSSQYPSVTLHCNGNTSFVFVDVANLSISGLRITNCGSELPNSKRSSIEILNGTKAALFLINIHTLQLTNVHIEKSCGYGLLGFNIVGSSTITSCRFSYNNRRKPNQNGAESSDTMDTCTTKGGNALLVFQFPFLDKEMKITMHISGSVFSHGLDASEWYELYDTFDHIEEWGPEIKAVGGGSGLGVVIHEPKWCCDAEYNLIVSITHCSFHNNTAPVGANALLVYQRNDVLFSSFFNISYAVHIDSCTFSYGNATLRGGGLAIELNDASVMYTRIPSVSITNSTFLHNRGREGGGLFYRSTNRVSCYQLFIRHHFHLEKCRFHENTAEVGGGMYMALQKGTYRATYNCMQLGITNLKPDCLEGVDGTFNVEISESNFHKNTATERGGGIHMYINTAHVLSKVAIVPTYPAVNATIMDCKFCRNKAPAACAVSVDGCAMNESAFCEESLQARCTVALQTSITISNATFRQNTPLNESPLIDSKGSGAQARAALHLHNIKQMSLRDTSFTENDCAGIYTDSTELYLRGALEFTRNRGHIGGAIYLDCRSSSTQPLIYLSPNTTLSLTNNTAQAYGGAIAAKEGCTGTRQCFFQFNFPVNTLCPQDRCNTTEEKIKYYNMKIILDGNKANLDGNAIYVSQTTPGHTCTVDSTQPLTPSIFQTVFELPSGNSSSEIASPPYKVCFCLNPSIERNTEGYECETSASIETFPGQTFHVPTVGIGQYNYPSQSVIRSRVLEGLGEIGERQTLQDLGPFCENLTYTVASLDETGFLKLHLSIEGSLAREVPLATVELTFKPCPYGFEVPENSTKCDCVAHLRKSGVTCDIDTQTILRPAAMWIGNYSGDVVVHTNCPLDYCKPKDIHIHLQSYDVQCAFNRSGVLCGACQQGLSLALGTSKCLQCSNFYLFLILAFAGAGVALVLLLLKCNLTVSIGTINGLIFYANIVRVNQATFFPHGNETPFTYFLSTFIAWLNLDLGIETCFLSGLDSYVRIWLQFLFPVYIWILVGVVIYSSRFSFTIAKLAGSNAVPVLATLFLLSYTKLLRTVIAAVSPITLTDRNGSVSVVWLVDGNVPYMNWPHTALFLMALVATLLFIVPYTAFVFLAPYLQATSGHRILRWVSKLKPLLDAYQGPYKVGFRYWTGLMLIVRLVLYAVFAGNTLGDPQVNLLAIFIVLLGLFVCFWKVGGVYKATATHAMECYFILNLGVYTAATQFLNVSRASQQSQEYLTYVMVGTAFIVFCGILCLHCYMQVQHWAIVQHLSGYIPKIGNRDNDHDIQLEGEVGEHGKLLFREPLLELI